MSVSVIPGPATAGVASDIALSKHINVADFVITAGYSAVVVRFVEIAVGVTIELGSDSDLEIS